MLPEKKKTNNVHRNFRNPEINFGIHNHVSPPNKLLLFEIFSGAEILAEGAVSFILQCRDRRRTKRKFRFLFLNCPSKKTVHFFIESFFRLFFVCRQRRTSLKIRIKKVDDFVCVGKP
jgi:hypothetical protein